MRRRQFPSTDDVKKATSTFHPSIDIFDSSTLPQGVTTVATTLEAPGLVQAIDPMTMAAIHSALECAGMLPATPPGPCFTGDDAIPVGGSGTIELISPDEEVLLAQLARHRGWLSLKIPAPLRRNLRAAGFIECDGHGKWRATDDGREWLTRKK